jgi:hypothetical protein
VPLSVNFIPFFPDHSSTLTLLTNLNSSEFRHPGWRTGASLIPFCANGIYCFGEQLFSLCSASGVEPPQSVALGTVCRDGLIVAATSVGAYVAQGLGMGT